MTDDKTKAPSAPDPQPHEIALIAAVEAVRERWGSEAECCTITLVDVFKMQASILTALTGAIAANQRMLQSTGRDTTAIERGAKLVEEFVGSMIDANRSLRAMIAGLLFGVEGQIAKTSVEDAIEFMERLDEIDRHANAMTTASIMAAHLARRPS